MMIEAPTFKTQVCEEKKDEHEIGDSVLCGLDSVLVKEFMDATKDNMMTTTTTSDMITLVKKLRQLVTCDEHNHANAIIQSGCLDKIVEIMQRDDQNKLQNEAAWTLCNVAKEGQYESQCIVDAGAVPKLVCLLSSKCRETRLSAAWAFLNITGTNTTARNNLLQQGIINHLIPLSNDKSTVMIQTATWVLRNLCRNKPPNPTFSQVAPCLTTLAGLICHSDNRVASLACWALADIGTLHGHHLLTEVNHIFSNTLVIAKRKCLLSSALQKLDKVVKELESTENVPVDVSKNNVSMDVSKNNIGLPVDVSKNNVLVDTSKNNVSVDVSINNVSMDMSKNNITVDVSKTNVSMDISMENQSVNLSRCHNMRKRKRREVTLSSVIFTRNSPKRMRITEQTNSSVSCTTWIKTRARTKQVILHIPRQNYSFTKRVQVDLWSAIETGDVNKVSELVEYTGPAVTRGSSGCTLLHVAVINNQTEVVEWLLQVLSPNLVNKDGLTPAHLAAMKGHTQVLRLLLADPYMDPLARDPAGNTYHHWLCVPLFEAVMLWDKNKLIHLINIGADPDLDGRRVLRGTLVRELHVTTARQLASALHRDNIFNCIINTQYHHHKSQLTTTDPFTTSTLTQQTRNFNQLPMSSLRLQMKEASLSMTKADMDNDNIIYSGNGAYVTMLNYTSFLSHPDLHVTNNSHKGLQNLANVFKKMGINGNIHEDLTKEQTKQVMYNVRDMKELENIGCAIFIISSHGTSNHQFLTSDGHLLHSRWLCDFFKDSQCLYLKNKPKLFIFDLCCGYYEHDGKKCIKYEESRVEEPLRDTVCLYSNSGELTWYKYSKDGTPFIKSLCYTLAHYGHQEFNDWYRHLFNHYTNILPSASPQLNNFGLNKKLFISSTPCNI